MLYIRELHQTLCRSQRTVTGVDQFGNRAETIFTPGTWKTRPNSPRRDDGREHQYCPPEHVQSEMDEMIRLHRDHMADAIAPDVEAAWLHHRFTQIHPFADGNGRVARALASLVLIKAGLFPFIVDNESQRGQYIQALETADQGDLRPLVSMVARQQEKALMQALDLSRDVIRDRVATLTVQSAIKSAGSLLKARESELGNSNVIEARRRAAMLKDIAAERFKRLKEELDLEFAGTGIKLSVDISTPERAWRDMLRKTGNTTTPDTEPGPTSPYDDWVGLSVKHERYYDILMVIRPIGLGSGRMFKAHTLLASSDVASGLRPLNYREPKTLFVSPDEFFITSQEQQDTMTERYRRWLDSTIADLISEWMKSL